MQECITKERLYKMIELHKKWLKSDLPARRLNLSHEIIKDVDLSDMDLSHAILYCAEFINVKMHNTKMSYSDAYFAKFSNVDFTNANLSWSDMRGTVSYQCDLRNANLNHTSLSRSSIIKSKLNNVSIGGTEMTETIIRESDIRNVDFNPVLSMRGISLFENTEDGTTIVPEIKCPKTGSFIGYKKVRIDKNIFEDTALIVELEIPEDALRSSATTTKCRCSKAKVLSITNLDGSDAGVNQVYNNKHDGMMYEVGKVSEVKDFNTDRWNECTTGIHFFMTREEAVKYIV